MQETQAVAVAWLCAGVMVLCILSSGHSSQHHLSLSHCTQNACFNRSISNYLLPFHPGCVKPGGAGLLGCIFSACASFPVDFLFYQLPLKSLWIISDKIVLVFDDAYSLSFVLITSSCCPRHSQFLRCQERQEVLCLQLSLQWIFLPSVPRCCSVITDILKKQRKKITGGGKYFCWGISAGCNSFWGWMVGRIRQQEEKWFFRSDRESSKCVGLCLAWLWDLPKHRGEIFHGSVVAMECGTKLSL